MKHSFIKKLKIYVSINYMAAPPSLALCDIPYFLYIRRIAIPGSLRHTVLPVHKKGLKIRP
jgi:hypothetical protein